MCNSDGEVRQVEDNSIIKSGAELADASGAARASAALTPEEVNKGPATKAAVATLPLAAIKTKTESAAGFLSLPRRGKHLVFDGRFLHAAPVELRSLNSNHDKNNSSDQTNKNSNNSKIGAAKRSNDGSSKHSSSSSSSSASSSNSSSSGDPDFVQEEDGESSGASGLLGEEEEEAGEGSEENNEARYNLHIVKASLFFLHLPLKFG